MQQSHSTSCCTSVPFKKLECNEAIGETLLLSDSIFINIDYAAIENAFEGKITGDRTYASRKDCRAWFPHKNVQAILQERLQRKKYDTVILAAPSVDISNQKIVGTVTKSNRDETISSCDAMVQAADFAICSGRAKRVLILQHAPRYDTQHDDPNGIRSVLARLFNKMVQCRRNQSQFAEYILVGSHTGLESEGSLRFRLFANDGTATNVRHGKFDGLHFYSSAGRLALTKSVISIIEHQMKVEKSKTESAWSDAKTGRGFMKRGVNDF